MPADLCCCGQCDQTAARVEQPDPWEGRMDGYCDACSWARCDTSYSVCPATVPQTFEQVPDLEAEVAALRADRDTLLDALATYGQHSVTCGQTNAPHFRKPCDCGLERVRSHTGKDPA